MRKIINNREMMALAITAMLLIVGAVFDMFGLKVIQHLTPVVLGAISALVILFWPAQSDKRLILSLVIILIGILVEVIGVNTGLLFGEYSYGDAIGLRLFGVPLLIGVVWLMVTVSAWQMALLFQLGKVASVVLATGLVVIFDLVLEQFASLYGLWTWQNGIIPLKNYATWAIVSATIFTLLALYAPQKRISLYGACMLPVLSIFFWVMLI